MLFRSTTTSPAGELLGRERGVGGLIFAEAAPRSQQPAPRAQMARQPATVSHFFVLFFHCLDSSFSVGRATGGKRSAHDSRRLRRNSALKLLAYIFLAILDFVSCTLSQEWERSLLRQQKLF